MTHYVSGARFDGNYTLLIEKNRPDWQAGLCNLIGGHVEEDETPEIAMAREFREETGIVTSPSEWERCVDIWVGENARLHVFRSFGPIHEARTMTDEPVRMVKLDNLPNNMLDNVPWLVELLKLRNMRFPISVYQTSRSSPVLHSYR